MLNPSILFCMLHALRYHALRCLSACLVIYGASQPIGDGQEIGLGKKKSCDQKVSTRASPWHGEERPGHSEECKYSFASLILPAHVVASLALPSVLGRFGVLRSSFGAS